MSGQALRSILIGDHFGSATSDCWALLGTWALGVGFSAGRACYIRLEIDCRCARSHATRVLLPARPAEVLFAGVSSPHSAGNGHRNGRVSHRSGTTPLLHIEVTMLLLLLVWIRPACMYKSSHRGAININTVLIKNNPYTNGALCSTCSGESEHKRRRA